jgi:hypothetical protein
MKTSTRSRYEEELVEDRQHNRVKVDDGGFVQLTPGFPVLGKIIDISRSGLAFRYVASKGQTNGSAVLNILTTDRRFCLEKVPAKIIRDSAMPEEFSFHSITLRHCAVQFGELTSSQKLGLEHFIRFNTLTWGTCKSSSQVKEPEVCGSADMKAEADTGWTRTETW